VSIIVIGDVSLIKSGDMIKTAWSIVELVLNVWREGIGEPILYQVLPSFRSDVESHGRIPPVLCHQLKYPLRQLELTIVSSSHPHGRL